MGLRLAERIQLFNGQTSASTCVKKDQKFCVNMRYDRSTALVNWPAA